MTDLIALFASQTELALGTQAREPNPEGQRSLVRFQIDGSNYAIDITHVRELVDEPSVTRYPEHADSHLGLVSVRGEVIPVRTLPGLGLGRSWRGESLRLLVVDYDDHAVFGLLVHGPKEVEVEVEAVDTGARVVTIEGDPVSLLRREDFV